MIASTLKSARDTLPADPGHGRSLPAGRPLLRILRALFARQKADVLAQLQARKRRISLARWAEPMSEVLQDQVLAYYRQGAHALSRTLAARLARGRRWGPKYGRASRTGRFGQRTKGERDVRDVRDVLEPAWDVFNDKAAAAARQAVLLFCRETNDAAERELNQALDALRQSLAQGLESGETGADLTRRVQALFSDPFRAHRIAMTEASRALHAGEVLLAQGTDGVAKGKKWLASGDACPRCLALGGKEVGLDEPFALLPGGGPYAAVYHPPAHPWCMCSQEITL